MKQSLRVLLEGVVDYAGLFPPASLPMDEAVANYARYRRGEHAWMLGRFVVPAARASEVPADFPLTILGGAQSISGGAMVELTAKSNAELEALAIPEGSSAFVEITDFDLIPRLAQRGLRAKLRTGGVTPEVFPTHAHIGTFMRLCAIEGVPFKLTAGLHHPLRCVRPLTYDADAPRGTMHGFVNAFMAAAVVHEAERILLEEDPAAFVFDDDFAAWRDKAVSVEHLRDVRRDFALSFGSCSFEEPIEDLRALGWL